MTVTYHGGDILRGTTAERTGGTWTNLPAGWIYIESDGLSIYRWNGTTWNGISTAPDAVKFYIYLDPNDSKFKARRGVDGALLYASSGSTDAQPTIQSAINDSSNAPGIIQLAPNTTFPLETIVSGSPDRSLNLRSGLTIKGAGPSSKLVTRSTGGGIIGLYGSNVTDVILEDFKIDGLNTTGNNNASAQGGNILVTATAGNFSERIWANRIFCLNSAEAGIKFSRTKNAFMTNNFVENTQLLSGIGYAGLEFTQASEQGIIMGNNLKNCGGEAIGIYGTASGDQNSRMIISNNNMIITSTSPLTEGGGGRGHILVEGSATNSSYNENTIIANNNILANYYCINLINAGRCEVSGNHCYSTGFATNSFSGIHSTGLGYDQNIHDNDIHEPGTYGIHIESPFGRIAVRNNRIYNVSNVTTNTYDGIYLVSVAAKTVATATIEGNDITDDRGGSKKMRDGIRIETVSSGVINNLLVDDNFTTGETGSKLNIIGTGHTYRRNKGTTAVNGGSATINIPHKLTAAPSTDGLTVLPLSTDALGSFYVTVDATNIILNYPFATPSGTANLSYAWSASIQR